MFHHNRNFIRLLTIGFAAIGEETMVVESGGVTAEAANEGVEVIEVIEPADDIITDALLSDSIRRNLDEANKDQAYIDSLEEENAGLRNDLQDNQEEIQTLRTVIADDADSMVDINAQIQANNQEITEAIEDRDRRQDVAAGEIDALGDDEDDD